MFNLHEPLITTAIIVGAPLVGLALHSVLVSVVRRTHRRRPFSISGLPLHVTHWFASFRLLIPSAMLAAAAPLLPAPATVRSTVTHVAVLGIIAGAAWVVTSTLAVARDIAMIHLQLQSADNLRGRRIFTQLRIIEQIATAATLIVALSFMLMTFSGVRQIGADLLASAGLVGLVLGLAAQRSIATILAGMQIAFNQPIRLDDVVVVEGESGRIEEITLTYVVVHIWDHRRLILPVTYFIERPFQNWTRTTAELLGTVSIYADYAVPVQPIRDELEHIVAQTTTWDRKTCLLQVANASEHTVELRALVSAANSADLGALRSEVRERLIGFLQTSYPDRLPRLRVELRPSQDAPPPVPAMLAATRSAPSSLAKPKAGPD